MHPAPVSTSLSLCENKTGHHDWYFPVDFSSHRSRPVLLWSFLFFLYFLLRFSALCMCCAVCAHVCVCEKQHALFTQNLWTWNQAMFFCVGNRCVWGGGCFLWFILSMGAVSNLYLCLQNTISIAVVFLILACSLRCKMKAHLICYRSKMTEHKVIPVLECHPLASSA